MTGAGPLRPSHRKTKTHDEVPPSHVLTQPGGPRGMAAHPHGEACYGPDL
jgi:hypothetical protein